MDKNLIKCPNCNLSIEVDNLECPNCCFPIAGAEKEKSKFYGQQIINTHQLKIAKTIIFFLRILFIGYGLWILIPVIFMINSGNLGFNEGIFIFAGISFILLGFFLSRYPILVLSLGILLLISLNSIIVINNWGNWKNGIYDPLSLFKWIFFEIIKFVLLIFAIEKNREATRIRNKSEYLNSLVN